MIERVTKLPELPPRKPDANKGDFGHVLVVAGSTGMAGAAVMTGEAALRAGAGLVTIATPKSVYPIVAAKTTCCLTKPLPETPAGTLSDAGYESLFDLAQKSSVVALGPGLGRHPDTTNLVYRLIAEAQAPTVVDADALNALAENVEVLQVATNQCVITPHPGEMSRLTGLKIDHIQRMREEVAAEFARERDCIVLLKGSGTVVTDGGRLFVNTTGNPGMATGGTGDILTGIIAALIAQGLDPLLAACLGAHLHGLAGDLAAEKFGQTSLIATDLLATLPEAFKKLSSTKRAKSRHKGAG